MFLNASVSVIRLVPSCGACLEEGWVMARRERIESTPSNRRPRLPPRPAPTPTGVRVRRRWSAARRRAYRGYKRVRDRFARGHAGVEKAPHWRRTWKKSVGKVVVTVGAILLVL